LKKRVSTTADATGTIANQSPVASLVLAVSGIESLRAAVEGADINPRVWIGQGQLQFFFRVRYNRRRT
jgi:hypothetical protein